MSPNVAVVLPAFNAEKTLIATLRDLKRFPDLRILLVDDRSSDRTVLIAAEQGIPCICHIENLGYGGNQKTCYQAALQTDAEVIVMLHPDYQYSPSLVPAMVAMIDSGEYDVALGSRILAQHAYKRGMPVYKYVANRVLTFVQNLLLGTKLSEFHTGFRAYRRNVLERIDWRRNSDDFIFDNEFLAQIIQAGFRIGEISVPTRYEESSSSIDLRRSIVYGIGVLRVSLCFSAKRVWTSVKSPTAPR